MTYRIAICGSSGYAGGELIRPTNTLTYDLRLWTQLADRGFSGAADPFRRIVNCSASGHDATLHTLKG